MRIAELDEIKIGWVHRFYSVGCKGSIAQASAECGVDPTCISDSITLLQQALRRPLMPSGSVEPTAFGKNFIPRAARVIDLSRTFPRNSANISVAKLRTIIAAENAMGIGAIANCLGISRFKAGRYLQELANTADCPLVDHAKDHMILTTKGQNVALAAREIIEILEMFRGPRLSVGNEFRRTRIKPWWLKVYSLPKS